MTRSHHYCVSVLIAWLLSSAAANAISPNEWRYRQTLDVPAAGLHRLDLPPATLGAARPALEDLRVLDAAGAEVPFAILRSEPAPELRTRPKSFRASLDNAATTIVIETGLDANIAGLELETAARDFIKPVRVEGSRDGREWKEIAVGEPLFRQPNGAAKLDIKFYPRVWEHLRLTVDDRRSPPVPFTGAILHREKIEPGSRAVTAAIKSRDESPGVTRLALDLGAANLRLASVELETPDPIFTRLVTVAVPEVSDEGIREQPLAEGTVHRVALDGATSARLDLPIEKQARSRELLVLIRNEDSPPLGIAGVRVMERPTAIVFMAREPGGFQLLIGNAQCAPPQYDLAALRDRIESAAAEPITASPLAENPDFRAADSLAGLIETGAPLDLAEWKHRKPVQLTGPGAQQLELDLELLSRASPSLADLRLVHEKRQVPYLLERPSISRALTPALAPANDPKRPRLSRWSLKLPHPALPLARLACSSATPLFEREMRLWEEVPTERGDKYPRELGRATWRRTPGRPSAEFALALTQRPATDTLLLETDNGDNPPIEIANVRVFHPVTRLVFKAPPGTSWPLELYYGNPKAAPPRYDVALVAAQLLAAEKSVAALGPEGGGKVRMSESLSGARRIVFWGVLALVVLALFAVLARLLPKATPPRSGT